MAAKAPHLYFREGQKAFHDSACWCYQPTGVPFDGRAQISLPENDGEPRSVWLATKGNRSVPWPEAL